MPLVSDKRLEIILGRLSRHTHDAFFRDIVDALLELSNARESSVEVSKKCLCDLRTRLIGSGCQICNPLEANEMALESAISTLENIAEKDIAANEMTGADAIILMRYIRELLKRTDNAPR